MAQERHSIAKRRCVMSSCTGFRGVYHLQRAPQVCFHHWFTLTPCGLQCQGPSVSAAADVPNALHVPSEVQPKRRAAHFCPFGAAEASSWASSIRLAITGAFLAVNTQYLMTGKLSGQLTACFLGPLATVCPTTHGGVNAVQLHTVPLQAPL